MKRILEVLSIIFVISGLLFVSCSSQDTAPKTEGTVEKGIYGEKAGEAMESAKDTTSGYGDKAKEMTGSYSEKAGEAMETAKDTAGGYGDKAKEAMTDYKDQAKEGIYGYTSPEKEAASGEIEKAKDAMDESRGSLDDMGNKAKDELGSDGK